MKITGGDRRRREPARVTWWPRDQPQLAGEVLSCGEQNGLAERDSKRRDGVRGGIVPAPDRVCLQGPESNELHALKGEVGARRTRSALARDQHVDTSARAQELSGGCRAGDWNIDQPRRSSSLEPWICPIVRRAELRSANVAPGRHANEGSQPKGVFRGVKRIRRHKPRGHPPLRELIQHGARADDFSARQVFSGNDDRDEWADPLPYVARVAVHE